MKDFKGKVVLITGASSGIGEALALAFAREGAKLVLTARDEARLKGVKEQCLKLGAECWTQAAEVTDEAQMQQLAAAVHARHGSLDVLVNNAGVVMAGLSWEVEAADWHRLHDINVMGVVHGIRAFVPKMIEAGRGGHIVNIASVAGLAGQRGMSTYCASKFAVVGLSECLRAETYRFGIGVSVICPGYVQTPIASKVKVVGSFDNAQSRQRIAEEFKNKLTPEQVAARTLLAIRRNEAVAGIGREALMASFARRWAPGLLERFQRSPGKPRLKSV
jgi:NADP-dependent 3-hydroxy acid dehydrogenase YdfG